MKDVEPQINISSINVAGIAGLGMVFVALVVAFSMPALRTLMIISIAGGVVGGAAFVMWRRRHQRPTDAHGPTLHLTDTIAPAQTNDDDAADKTVRRLREASECP